MKCRWLFVCFMVALSVIGVPPVFAMDANGPYNNSHTAVSFARDCDYFYLNAINAADAPYSFLNEEQRDLQSIARVIQGGQFINPAYWQSNIFANDDFVLEWDEFPSLLCENNHLDVSDPLGLDGVQATTANRRSVQWMPQLAVGEGCILNNEWNFVPAIIPPTDLQVIFTRMIALRRSHDCDRQWIAGYNELTRSAFVVKTTDGWLTSEWMVNHLDNLPDVAIYSLAIDDRWPSDADSARAPKIAFAVVSSDPNLLGSRDPHTNHIRCNGLIMTLDGGEAWWGVYMRDWPENAYNVHVSMISMDQENPEGDYRIYVVGLNDPSHPSIFCRWGTLSDQGLEWDPSTTGFSGGSVKLPNYPFDMIVERDHHANPQHFHLLVATQNQLFFAEHVDGPILWRNRNAGLTTYNFHDIAVVNDVHEVEDALHGRDSVWAIAGETCSYMTSNAGANWWQVWNSDNRMLQFAGAGARQANRDSMAVIYSRPPFTTLPAAQTHYAPICIQLCRHLEGIVEQDTFKYVLHAGFTYPSCSGFIAFDISPTDGAKYWASWADPFLGINTNPIYTKGVAFYSSDRGRSWRKACFNNRLWDGSLQRVPLPSKILADPLSAQRAYLSFHNVNGTTHVTSVPPFSYSLDGGQNWLTPDNRGMPLGAQQRLLAVGYEAGNPKLYMTVGVNLFRTDNLGAVWRQLPLPHEFNGQPLVSVSCPDIRGNHVVIACRDYFAISDDAGVTWSFVNNLDDPIEQVVADPYDENSLRFWAVTRPSVNNRQPTLHTSFDGGITWSEVATWGNAAEGYYPLLTDVYVERAGAERPRRVIWTAVREQVGIVNAAGPSVINFFEDEMRNTQTLDATEAVGAVPKAYQLYQNYPNPFNPITTIRFDLPVNARVHLRIFDLQGRLIRTVADEEFVAGTHQIVFDGRDLPSGTYFMRMQAGDFSNIRKMLLVK